MSAPQFGPADQGAELGDQLLLLPGRRTLHDIKFSDRGGNFTGIGFRDARFDEQLPVSHTNALDIGIAILNTRKRCGHCHGRQGKGT